MQKAKTGSLKKKAAAIVALLAVAATTVGGTLAWQDYKQHKSNELSGSQIKYDARLVEDFEEVFDWKAGEGIKKEIRVANAGTAAAGYGDVYVRLQLKEFMQTGEMVFVETPERYMVANGNQKHTAKSGKTYEFKDGHYVIFDSQEDAKSVFPNNTKYLEDKVTGEKGWFIETQKGDFNGQYGKHVVIEYDFGTMTEVIPGSKFCPADQRNHHGIKDPVTGEYDIWSLECDYPLHGWGAADETAPIDAYIEWLLGADVIRLSAWDGKPVAAWIVDDDAIANRALDGWAYWGQALAPETATSNILEKVLLINQPDGNFYYVIHTDMQALSIDEFLKPDGEGKDWKVKESYVNNRPTIELTNLPDPAEVKVGETLQPPTVKVGPEGAAQGPLEWTSARPDYATVDPATGVVTGVKAGGPVTIIVKAPNGARGQYTVMVTAGDAVNVPVESVSLDKNALSLAPNGTGKLTATVNPADATNKAVTWKSSNEAVATVDASGNVTAVGTGTATITVTTVDGGKTATCTVTVEAGASEEIPTQKGEGPYAMVGNDDDKYNYAVSVTMTKTNFDNGNVDPAGSLKLRDIIAASYGSNYSDITVTADPASLNSKVSIGADKNGDAAILITYYGTQAQWDAAYALPGHPYPQVQMTLVLHADGYADTVVKVDLAFNGSLYVQV